MPRRSVLHLLALATAALTAPVAAAQADESGQARAREAGRSLIGTAMPAFKLRTIDGKTIDLSTSLGKKPIYLKFWATWCLACRGQMPAFKQDYRRLRDRMTVIAVNTGFNDDIARVRAFRRQHGLTMPIVIDHGELAAALHLRVTPQHVVVGRDGRIAYVGHLEDLSLHRAFAAALGEHKSHSSSGPVTSRRVDSTISDQKNDSLPAAWAGKPTLLWFMSPWCESYLAKTRPVMARRCRSAREAVTQLAARGRTRVVGVASGLWATDNDLRDYRARMGLRIPLTLDADGAVFRRYRVSEVPALLLINTQGNVVRRVPTKGLRLGIAAKETRAGDVRRFGAHAFRPAASVQAAADLRTSRGDL